MVNHAKRVRFRLYPPAHRWYWLVRGSGVAHFLRPGKTDGATVNGAPRQHSPTAYYFFPRHLRGVYLANRRRGNRVVFFLRALSALDSALCSVAEQVMHGLAHEHESDWNEVGAEAYFRARGDDVLFVGRQEGLDADFATLVARADGSTALPREDEKAHRNPEGGNPRLSVEAEASLRRWYAADYAFIESCRSIGPWRHI